MAFLRKSFHLILLDAWVQWKCWVLWLGRVVHFANGSTPASLWAACRWRAFTLGPCHSSTRGWPCGGVVPRWADGQRIARGAQAAMTGRSLSVSTCCLTSACMICLIAAIVNGCWEHIQLHAIVCLCLLMLTLRTNITGFKLLPGGAKCLRNSCNISWTRCVLLFKNAQYQVNKVRELKKSFRCSSAIRQCKKWQCKGRLTLLVFALMFIGLYFLLGR